MTQIIGTKNIKAFADEIRPDLPEKAAEIDAVVMAHQSMPQNNEPLTLEVGWKLTLEKFDGDYSADKLPVETIVREGSL